jgi:hypothetical protein
MFCSKCGRPAVSEDRFCSGCGQVLPQFPAATIVRTAKAHRSRTLLIVLVGILAIIGLVTVITSLSTQDSATSAATPVQATPKTGPETSPPNAPPLRSVPVEKQAVPEEPAVPTDESEFLSIIGSFQRQYREASNEFQKSTVRKERAKAFVAVLSSFSVNDWIGQVSSMQTTSDGHGILYVRLPGNTSATVQTWNNGLSDSGSGTLISPGSALFEQVSHLAIGDKVIFSGTFAAGNLDYLRETSLTEAGSMTEPEFIFTFRTVQLGSSKP